MRSSTISIIIAISALLPSSFAFAQEETLVVHVHPAGLDLLSSEGAAIFQRRISSAVTEVCGAAPLSADLQENSRVRKCRSAAQADAQAQVAKIIAAARRPLKPGVFVYNRPIRTAPAFAGAVSSGIPSDESWQAARAGGSPSNPLRLGAWLKTTPVLSRPPKRTRFRHLRT
jgi:UrcA family protein